MIQYYRKKAGRLVALCAAALAAASCTHDYLVDETNLRLYIPQIKDKSVDNVLVSIHDENGNHHVTRYVATPFYAYGDGILRFKLPVTNPNVGGPKYTVTCFANVHGKNYDEGKALTESFIYEPMLEGVANMFTPGPNVRIFKHHNVMTSLQFKLLDTNLAPDSVYKAKVQCEFTGLPDIVKRIDITYGNVGTHLCYDGNFAAPGSGEVRSSFAVPASGVGNGVTYTHTDLIYPTPGVHYMSRLNDEDNTWPKFTMKADFYGENGILLAHFSGLDGGEGEQHLQPTGPDGQPITNWSRHIHPRESLKIKFNGFVVAGIVLEGWGDITGGDVSPM